MNNFEQHKKGLEDEKFWAKQNKILEQQGQSMADRPKSKWQQGEKDVWSKARKNSLEYINKQDKINIDIRNYQIQEAIKKYGVSKTNQILQQIRNN